MSEMPRMDSDAMWNEATAMAEAWCKELDPCQRDGAIYCYRAGYLKAARTLERELNHAKYMLEAMERLSREKSPFCEHNAQFSWSPDGQGKKIICLLCAWENINAMIIHRGQALACSEQVKKAFDAVERELNETKARLAEAMEDKARLDWIEKHASSSGYHLEIHGCSVFQSNAVIVKTGCGSGPFQKEYQGQKGNTPARYAIDAAMKGQNETKPN